MCKIICFYRKSKGKGGNGGGEHCPICSRLTPVDPVGEGEKDPVTPKPQIVHFTPQKAKLCHLVLKILFLDPPRLSVGFPNPTN